MTGGTAGPPQGLLTEELDVGKGLGVSLPVRLDGDVVDGPAPAVTPWGEVIRVQAGLPRDWGSGPTPQGSSAHLLKMECSSSAVVS